MAVVNAAVVSISIARRSVQSDMHFGISIGGNMHHFFHGGGAFIVLGVAVIAFVIAFTKSPRP